MASRRGVKKPPQADKPIGRRNSMEQVAWTRILEEIGVKKVIEILGPKRLLEEIGLKRFIAAAGLVRLFEEAIAALSPEERAELRQQLENDTLSAPCGNT